MTRIPILLLLVTLACGGSSSPPTTDHGRLWIKPSPATITPGAQLTFYAIPDVTNEAPGIQHATWSVVETGGGTVLPLTSVGDSATYTAPATAGTFHLTAITEHGTLWYVPQPATIHVIDSSLVTVSASPNTITFPLPTGVTEFPRVVSAVSPITNPKVAWSVVESGYGGDTGITISPDPLDPTSAEISYDPSNLQNLPGNLCHIKVQSAEVPSAYALVTVNIQK